MSPLVIGSIVVVILLIVLLLWKKNKETLASLQGCYCGYMKHSSCPCNARKCKGGCCNSCPPGCGTSFNI